MHLCHDKLCASIYYEGWAIISCYVQRIAQSDDDIKYLCFKDSKIFGFLYEREFSFLSLYLPLIIKFLNVYFVALWKMKFFRLHLRSLDVLLWHPMTTITNLPLICWQRKDLPNDYFCVEQPVTPLWNFQLATGYKHAHNKRHPFLVSSSLSSKIYKIFERFADSTLSSLIKRARSRSALVQHTSRLSYSSHGYDCC